MARGRKPIILVNDIKERFTEEWWGREDLDMWPLWIDDIVSGVARLDWYGDRPNQIPLATTNIIKCFVFLDEISTENIMKLLEYKKSQAKLYLKACQLCYPFFKRSLENKETLNTRYRRESIVSYEQGLKYHYDVQHRSHI